MFGMGLEAKNFKWALEMPEHADKFVSKKGRFRKLFLKNLRLINIWKDFVKIL